MFKTVRDNSKSLLVVDTHPAVTKLYKILGEQKLHPSIFGIKIGISDYHLDAWRLGKQSPKAYDLNEALNELGYELVLRKVGERQPSRLEKVNTGARRLTTPDHIMYQLFEEFDKYQFSMAELSEVVEMSTHRIHKWRSDKHFARLSYAEKLARVLGYTILAQKIEEEPQIAGSVEVTKPDKPEPYHTFQVKTESEFMEAIQNIKARGRGLTYKYINGVYQITTRPTYY